MNFSAILLALASAASICFADCMYQGHMLVPGVMR